MTDEQLQAKIQVAADTFDTLDEFLKFAEKNKLIFVSNEGANNPAKWFTPEKFKEIFDVAPGGEDAFDKGHWSLASAQRLMAICENNIKAYTVKNDELSVYFGGLQ